jgi:hypothetical protein
MEFIRLINQDGNNFRKLESITYNLACSIASAVILQICSFITAMDTLQSLLSQVTQVSFLQHFYPILSLLQ